MSIMLKNYITLGIFCILLVTEEEIDLSMYQTLSTVHVYVYLFCCYIL